MKEETKITTHGSAVVLKSALHDPSAVFLRGTSGSGKSDLAFRLIESGCELVCDDQVVLEKRQGKIFADSIESIRGLIEVRGVGLLRYPVAAATRLRLIIDLSYHEDVPRLPEWETEDILGVALPRLKLHAFDVSTPLKIRKAMEIVHRPQMIVK